MAGLHVGDFGSPDEVRSPDKTKVDVVRMGDSTTAARLTLQPGWRWSESVGPIAGTPSCQIHHNCYVVQGRLHIRMDDGGEGEVGPGDVFVCPPGHDAWVVSDEPCVLYDFAGSMAQEYAKEKGRRS